MINSIVRKKKNNSFPRVLFKNFLSINLKTGYKNRFENRAVPAGGTLTAIWPRVLRLLNPSIAGFRLISDLQRDILFFLFLFFFFCEGAFARDRDDCCRKGCFGEGRRRNRGNGLNAHSKFRLNGISMRTEHVPKGNLPNVAPVSDRRDTRGAVFGPVRSHWPVGGEGGGGGEGGRRTRGAGSIMRNEIVTIIVRERGICIAAG